MIRNIGKITIVFVLLTNTMLAQNIFYTYSNFTIKEGLAGNNVYCATQDKEGFLWFGTETGLSRFDGTHFKNYTINDGLADNEIIKMFCDSKGRVWFAPFRKSICYYFKGKIYNQDNSSFLKPLVLQNSVIGICEDIEGNIYLNQRNRLTVISKEFKITDYDSLNHEKISGISEMMGVANGGIHMHYNNKFVLFNNSSNSEIILKTIGAGQNSYTLSNKYFVVDGDNEFSKSENKYIFNIKNKNWDSIKSNHKFNSHNIIDDSLLFINKNDGCIMHNLNNLNNVPDTFLHGISIAKVIKDNEGGLWFLSTGHGIFKLASKRMYNFKKNSNTQYDINFIKKDNNFLHIANSEGEIFVSNNNFKSFRKISLQDKNINFKKLIDLIHIKNYDKIYITPELVYYKKKKISLGGSIKSVNIINDSILISATSSNAVFFNYKSFILDTANVIWAERATSVLYAIDSVFVGSLNGLYVVKKDNSNYCLSSVDKILERRISAIKQGADGTIWVGTYDAGVAAYKDGKVLQSFNDNNGLTSNICRTLFANGNYLWVGTDKGLNKIDISKPPYKILINYTTADGLASNMINAVYTDSNMVYVGSPEGLTFFDESKIINDSRCDLRILGLTISGKEIQWDNSKITLSHKDNNIRFDFVALSFKSAGDITYYYRLIGLDNNWKKTKENFLAYPTLPSGIYTLEIQATNKFGLKSNIIKVDFEIEQALLEKNWFKLLLAFFAAGLIYFYGKRRIKKIKQLAIENDKITEKFNELEQMALKAQMNPHFIFNCLNSIQEYVINSDVEGANKYISDFSKLIRSTLDNSAKKTISVEDEIKYLTNYLTIEQYRFENKFLFNINYDTNIDLQENNIPPMLLQPYIENALRHGIKNKKEGVGLIQINILKQNNNLICEVIDNGIGRNASQALKGKTNIEYQSKGMELTAKRIKLLNRNIGNEIVIKIDDVALPELGTKVTISIPIK